MSIFIEVKGIGIPNKGAELMLVALMEHFAKKGTDVKFVSEPYTDYFHRARYGLYQRASFAVKGVRLDWIWSLVPSRLRKQYGIILDREIDVILDASGFAYGDQWGVEKLVNRLSKRVKKYKMNGTRVILMPQAFGPFKKPGFEPALKELAAHADLICVRDRESYQHLTAIVGESKNIAPFPDFTGIVSPSEHPVHNDMNYGICFIPNAKMIEMREDGDIYKAEMIKAVRWAYENRYKVTLLVHEGIKDMNLAKDIRANVHDEIVILGAADPKEIKQIIGQSSVVVSSRFHGLVSALSQGIPAIATGWSHKYRELMLDYKIEEMMVEDFEDLTRKLQWVCIEENSISIKATLNRTAAIQKKQIALMWDRIDSILKLN